MSRNVNKRNQNIPRSALRPKFFLVRHDSYIYQHAKKTLQKKACFKQQCILFHFRHEHDLKGGKRSKSKPNGNSQLSQDNPNQKHKENALPQNQTKAEKVAVVGVETETVNTISVIFLGQLQDVIRSPKKA